MAFDGMFTHAMTHELNALLQGSRVMKISQPFPNEIILTMRAHRTNYPVLLSAHPNYARVQVTTIPYTNPPVPTNFTMVLRKYLENAHLVAIEQPANDRVMNFKLLTRTELGDQLPLVLSVEIMGRYSNIILVNQEENRIIDAIKHVGMDQDRYRTILPNAEYRVPPKQNKINPFSLAAIDIVENTVQTMPQSEWRAQLQRTLQGLNTASARLLVCYLQQDGTAAMNLNRFLATADHPTPVIISTGNQMAFSFTSPLTDNPTISRFATLSAMLDQFYQEKATRDRVNQQGSRLIHVVKQNLKKNKTKLKKLQRELAATDNADNFRIKGELLTTYMRQLRPGMKQVTVPNFYDNNRDITISLSPELSPSRNAQKYFKRYNKLKNGVKYITHQIELTTTEINYLDSIATQVELATPGELPDIKMELQQQGYLRPEKRLKSGKRRRQKLSRPDQYIASDGTPITVGKNNLQNDQLTLKAARKSDIWLHAKNVPGSHVIVSAADPSETTLTEAAQLAAYFSKARTSANVPVDYVAVRHIRKPNGAKPGFVIYKGQHTLFVTPNKTIINQLKKTSGGPK
ncbi:NFACT family protein [Ligilactobacillus sp. LYQ60]|uniref:Rqc2 family fibronectin-binding protein n=1 Tax=unclassified Ligilactobacillus TaxID=2767920 RepID=UPI00385531E2